MIIESYTKESGVRGLEKMLAKIVRNRATSLAMGKTPKSKLDVSQIEKILGLKHYTKELYNNDQFIGVAIGLAWTPFGGDILFIESSISSGKGKLTITGNIGKVMKESAVLALEYLKFKSEAYSIEKNIFTSNDFHLHVPEGAIPKDGPSAGITILSALASLVTNRRIKKSLALTGEITLRGKVLPVGGIKEKILAAHRAGIKHIILSRQNEKDINDIKDVYIKGLTFYYVDLMEEVLDVVLLKS
jgi:ATP-dependent Lon protease